MNRSNAKPECYFRLESTNFSHPNCRHKAPGPGLQKVFEPRIPERYGRFKAVLQLSITVLLEVQIQSEQPVQIMLLLVCPV